MKLLFSILLFKFFVTVSKRKKVVKKFLVSLVGFCLESKVCEEYAGPSVSERTKFATEDFRSSGEGAKTFNRDLLHPAVDNEKQPKSFGLICVCLSRAAKGMA